MVLNTECVRLHCAFMSPLLTAVPCTEPPALCDTLGDNDMLGDTAATAAKEQMTVQSVFKTSFGLI